MIDQIINKGINKKIKKGDKKELPSKFFYGPLFPVFCW